MKLDKKSVKTARQTFQSSLRASRIHYRRARRDLQKMIPKKRFIVRRAEKGEVKEGQKKLKIDYQNDKEAARETFSKSITYLSPKCLKANEIRKYRLPQAKNRLKLARKHLAEVKFEEKTLKVDPKFIYQNPSKSHHGSRFKFVGEKSLKRLEAEKEVLSAKRNLNFLKRTYHTKNVSYKVRRGFGFLLSESLDVLSQDDDLDSIRTLKDVGIKSRRYGRFAYQSGKVIIKGNQAGIRFTKNKQEHFTERVKNFKNGKGWTRQKPVKSRRRYQTFLKRTKRQGISSLKRIYQSIRGSMTFFSTIVMNPMTWVISGLIFIFILMMCFVMGVSGMSLIQQDEIELTKSYTHMTWEDAEHTRTNDKRITYYTKIDDVMAFMNHKYQSYALNDTMEDCSQTYKDFLSQIWKDLNDGATLKTMAELTKEPAYKLSDEESENLKELREEGTYLSLQELDNPFQGHSTDEPLIMTYRYGYDVNDHQASLHHHIILEAKENQVIVAPMDGKISLDGKNVIITSGKGLKQRKLTLYQVNLGRVSEGQNVLAGDIIGQIKDGSGLKVTYEKADDDSDKLVFVNPSFYFPKVIQLQTTILPSIGQFGGDEFARAKAIYVYLKGRGASDQAIAAILGNWSVESSITPKRAEGDYLSPPIGASDSSWDDEEWLSLNGPSIYSGTHPNILKRGLGLGQWTDTSDGSRRHSLILDFAKNKQKKWYDLELQLDFMLDGDHPYYTNWLKGFLNQSGSPASLAQLFLLNWEGNSGDKLLERQTRATEWYYQIQKGFSQPDGGKAQSDPKSLEAVRGDLYENSISGGGDGMGYAYGQCTWGVASRINQLGLKLKGRNGEKISIISAMGNGQDWVRTAASLGGETGQTPREGAIISFVGGSHETYVAYGHVAFVEKVYLDGSFLISETNYNGNPNYTFRKLSGVDSNISFAYTTK